MPTARWTILASKQGLPLGLFCPPAFSIHPRSTGGATYRLSRHRACRSRRLSATCSAYCVAVTWSPPGALFLRVRREAARRKSRSIRCNTLLNTIAGERGACGAICWSCLAPVGEPRVSPRGPSRGRYARRRLPSSGSLGTSVPPPASGLCAATPANGPPRGRSVLPRLPRSLRGAPLTLCPWVSPGS